ncbi:MAG: hypothetical protein KJ930_03560 [Gammaproteobacteria bacterium]|nr:hypothetical protein [Gammaproteobacteria bacterium]MBU2225115.1 hypothetical protein [Gammaproteobacteria bacterium]
MKSDGFVLIVCLCFIALVSSMALSALLIGLLSQKIGIAGQVQLQQLTLAKSHHLQLVSQPKGQLAAGDLTLCPAQVAVWTQPVTRCRWQALSSQYDQLAAWSSLVLTTELQLPQEAL